MNRIMIAVAVLMMSTTVADAQGWYGPAYGSYGRDSYWGGGRGFSSVQQQVVDNTHINQNMVIPMTSVSVSVEPDRTAGIAAMKQAEAINHIAHKDDPVVYVEDRMELVKGWSFTLAGVKLPLYDFWGVGPEINELNVVNRLLEVSKTTERFEHFGYSRLRYIPFKDKAMKELQKCDGVLAGNDKHGDGYVLGGIRLIAR